MKNCVYDYSLILNNSNFAIDNIKMVKKLAQYKSDSMIKNNNNKSRNLFAISNTIELLEEVKKELSK